MPAKKSSKKKLTFKSCGTKLWDVYDGEEEIGHIVWDLYYREFCFSGNTSPVQLVLRSYELLRLSNFCFNATERERAKQYESTQKEKALS